MPTVFVSIGSNIDREYNIRAAVNALKQHFNNLTLSSVYEAAAVGFKGDAFFNLIAAFDTELSATDVDILLDDIEKQHGRTKEQKKFNSRTLDLDLILYDDFISDNPNLEIPRSDITLYAFVLEPLAEIAGHLKHPVLNITYDDMWRNFDKQAVTQQPINFSWG